jgi:hypothetical protein
VRRVRAQRRFATWCPFLVSQLIGPVTNKQPDYEEISMDEQELNDKLLVNNIELIMNEDNELTIDENEEIKSIEDIEQKQKSTHQRRSMKSRQSRNRKRNNTHRMRRYQHYITRPMYHKFKMPLVRKILDQRDIDYTHVKEVNGLLIIGVKDDKIKQQYQDHIPEDMFDRQNYQYHRSHHQHHQYHRRHYQYHYE